VAGMRRLLLLVSVLVCVDTMLFAALTPLLPHFAHEFGLSKAQAGVLVAAYAAGALVGGIPGGWATVKIGSRRAVLVGLVLMALASIGFAFADSFWSLFAARFLQGLGSGFTWAGAMSWLLAAAPRDRRGEMMGTAMGAAVFGALFGPVLGALAAIAGRDVVFVALSGLSVILGAWALRIDDAPAEEPSWPALGAALRNRTFLAGLGFMTLPALLFGIVSVLGPLHLSAAGWGAAAIGGVWLVNAAFEAVQAPFVGRLVDRRGNYFPVRISLVAGTVVSLLLAVGSRPAVYVPLLLLASLSYAMLFTPAFTLLADGAEAVGLAQGMAFGMMNAAWATGALLGPAAGGAIADTTGDSVPFLIAAVLCAGSFVLVRPRSARRSTAVRPAKL
jgi:MFS family permease